MLKVGIAGLGVMGKHHLRILSEFPEVESIGIYDLNIELAKELGYRFKAEIFQSFDNMLKAVDAVVIATPTTTHKDLALQAIEAGKHLLVEKPLAENSRFAEEIIRKARDKGVLLMVGHVERFNPVVARLKEHLLEQKPLIISITRVGPFPPRIRDSGVILDLAIHDIDILSYLLEDEPEKISCFKSSFLGNHEDSAVLIFKFKETLAQLTTNWLTPFKVRKIEVATEKEYYVGDLLNQKLSKFSRYTEQGAYIVHEIPVKFSEPLKEELRAFVNSILCNKEPFPSGEEALKNIKIAEKCLNYEPE